MSFTVAAEAYDRFMGRYSGPFAPAFADFAGVAAGDRVIDVGCGPGALTRVLADRVGADHVTAVDPAEQFVAAARARVRGATVQQGTAESLPFEDGEFDAALAQLVVHFMADPVAGLGEMARVTRLGGVVAACVWDHGGGRGPISVVWEAAHELDPGAPDESELAGVRAGHLAGLFAEAGIGEIESGEISVAALHPTFEEWWEPFTLGVGPAGAYVARLDSEAQARLCERCREKLPDPPFTITAWAWAVRGHASTA
jgi:SAM-dependent methyltransferase